MKTAIEIVKYLLIVYNIILMYGTITNRKDKNSLIIFLLSAVTVAYLIIK